MIEKYIFYFFAAILVFAATRVITVKNPVHAALFLVLGFFSSAAIWMLLHAEFLAIALILVYVGAVMVLFLFVIMMLDINITVLREGFVSYLPIALLVGIIILIEMGLVLWNASTGLATPDAIAAFGNSDIPNTKLLGHALYTTYVYPFEIAAAILLVAMVAAIALTMREKRQHKYIAPEKQVYVKREDCVRLVKMASEPKD
ncbi:NADH-quinone oxidoreductase subunit J [Candidatus Albibeggiatoa sp. nov. BB20]|uniref:NADH-quinone oxidoreductase subunit J n=1 Tax=Candidatus Albibeggiatoa sp. nov. BB20 TaxID=3162723 RepID=UPI003365B146